MTMAPKYENAVSETLEEKSKRYGDYLGSSRFRAEMMRLIQDRDIAVHGEHTIPGDITMMLFDIISKLSRIAASPLHQDSWHDIAGYAMLAEKAIEDMKGDKDAKSK